MIPNRSLLPLAALALAGPAAAQNNISWVTFHQDDTLLSGSSSTLLNDQQEKNFYSYAEQCIQEWQGQGKNIKPLIMELKNYKKQTL